jgi:type IV pilus assembly protein PilY1
MFQQAYNELLDMDGDGRIDTGFNPKVVYYGYFDSLSCYKYVGNVNRDGDSRGYFVRSGPTMEDYSQDVLNQTRDAFLQSDAVIAARSTTGICQPPHANESGNFSGNWLNYLVTSRMDVIRKILYGGFRLTDSPTETILEPTLVPRDANSWGTDVLADDRWVEETPNTPYYDISKFTPFPKPQSQKAHFFARVRNTQGWGTYQVFEYLLNANKNSFHWGPELTGTNGRYFDWVLQDGPNPSTNRLSVSWSIRAYGLKIKVCDQGNVGEGEDCRQYPKGNLKPVGLLQKNGESGEMFFGLLSGSYDDNTRLKGGVLRNHIGHIKDSVDIDNYGQIKRDGLIWNLDTFRISSAVDGTGIQAYRDSASWGNPVGEMLFEGVRYMARLGQGPLGTPMRPTQDFLPWWEVNYNPANRAGFYKEWVKLPDLPGAECAKPIILLISEVDSEFDGDSGVNSSNDLNMKLLTNILPSEASYLPNFNLSHYLNLITGLENYNNGATYFYARNRTDECAPKPIKSLQEINGICPYRTSYEGTYSAAAVSFFAHTHNFGLADREMPLDIYTVTMSGAFPSLEFPLKRSNGQSAGTISILPASMSNSSRKYAMGRILSFLNYYILEWWVDQAGLPYHVKVKVNYEDSAQGHNEDFGWWPNSDWDMDVMIEHTIDLLTTKSPNLEAKEPLDFRKVNRASGALKVKGGTYFKFRSQGKTPFTIDANEVAGLAIKSWKANNSTGERMALGYSISGTTHDGTYMDLGHCGGIDTYATPPTCDWPKGYGQNSAQDVGTKCKQSFGECPSWNRADNKEWAVIRTFEFDPDPKASGDYLPSPLFLAAKYGGFSDANRNGRPDPGEWEGPDGNPRNFFKTTNISELPAKLEAAFRDISQTAAASSSTSINVNSVLGGGVAALTAFYPKYVNPSDTSKNIRWVGTVYGLFVDKFGNFREDSNRNKQLDLRNDGVKYKGDYVVAFNSLRSPPVNPPKCYVKGTQITLCADPLGDNDLAPTASQKSNLNIHGLKPLFDTGRWLSELKDPSVRKIYYADATNNFKATPFVDNPETVNKLKNVLLHDDYNDVLPAPIGPGNKPSKEEVASKLIRYIRGEDIPLWRSRTVGNPWDDGKTQIVWRFGDTINSKPIIVGPPAFSYDLLYRDESYAAFKRAKANRRQVVYVGSNDGFFRAINLGYRKSLANGQVAYDGGGYDLGAELWALIPWSTLPHLKWLGDPGYVHSYYVDLKPVVADIQYQGEWRTILLIGLRLGGRPIESPTATPANPENFFSEIVALDVTNPKPNEPPEILWRFSSEKMGLAVGLPAVIYNSGQWYVVIPSGPAMDHPDPKTGQLVFGSKSPYEGYSDQRARLFVLEAISGQPVLGVSESQLTIPEDNTFFSDPYVPRPLRNPKAPTWHDETIYYGYTVSRNKQGLDGGGVYRLQMIGDYGLPVPPQFWKLKLLAKVDRPVSSPVNSAFDSSGNLWVFFGTGRLWGLEDINPCSKVNVKPCFDNHEHYLFGIKEELDQKGFMTFSTRDVKSLVDISGTQVYNSGVVTNLNPAPGLVLGTGGTTTYEKLAAAFSKPAVIGYQKKLEITKLLQKSKSSIEMVLTQPQVTSVGADKAVMAFTTYELTAQSCGDFGRGFMYTLDPFTGLPAPRMSLGYPNLTGPAGPGLLSGGVSTGFGQPTGATIANVDGKVIIRASTSENSVYSVELANENKLHKNLISWREVLNSGLNLPPEMMTDKVKLNP